MKKVKEIKVFFEDAETLENETIVYSDLEDKCAVIWGVDGIEFYEDAISMNGVFDANEIKKRKDLLVDVYEKCKEKGIEPLFIKTTDCLPR